MSQLLARSQKVPCPVCGKRVREIGLAEHRRYVHEGGSLASAFVDRVLTEQELAEIECRSDIDFIDRARLTRGRLSRALMDRQLLLGHIRALGLAGSALTQPADSPK